MTANRSSLELSLLSNKTLFGNTERKTSIFTLLVLMRHFDLKTKLVVYDYLHSNPVTLDEAEVLRVFNKVPLEQKYEILHSPVPSFLSPKNMAHIIDYLMRRKLDLAAKVNLSRIITPFILRNPQSMELFQRHIRRLLKEDNKHVRIELIQVLGHLKQPRPNELGLMVNACLGKDTNFSIAGMTGLRNLFHRRRLHASSHAYLEGIDFCSKLKKRISQADDKSLKLNLNALLKMCIRSNS